MGFVGKEENGGWTAAVTMVKRLLELRKREIKQFNGTDSTRFRSEMAIAPRFAKIS